MSSRPSACSMVAARRCAASGCALLAGGALLAAAPYADEMARTRGGQLFKWSSVNPSDLGDKPVRYDDTGLRKIPSVPKPGVHPRIYFGPDELPEIRRRLQETRCGREVWLNMLAWIHAMKGPYDPEADYAKPQRVWKRYRVPLFRIAGKELENVGQLYPKLVAGDTRIDPGYHWYVFPLEAFRCLIEDDGKSAQELASALITSIKYEQAKRKDPQPRAPAGGNNLALSYDFIHQWLTPEQRDFIRKELVAGTWHHAHYGTFLSPAVTLSDLVSLESFMPVTLLAIEGEEGFNEFKYKGTVRAWRNFLTYAWCDSGLGYEGMGRNAQFADTMTAFAKRGDNVIAHQHVSAYATNFLPHSVQPYGYSFATHDQGGGTGLDLGNPDKGNFRFNAFDAIGLKYLFPDNKVVDWVFRNWVGENYQYVPDRPDGPNNALITWAIFASDFDPKNSEPSKLLLGRTFFCPERGLFMARSNWTNDAIYLHLNCRQYPAGPSMPDRNGILLSGKGRLWGIQGPQNDTSDKNSVVVIDGRGQDRFVPGRMVAYVDNPLASFACGDAKYAWDWKWGAAGKPEERVANRADKIVVPKGWEKEMQTPNDFRFTTSAEPRMNKPFFMRDDWLMVGRIAATMRQPNYPVRKAYRTAGVVRGGHPYALVIDDIRKDDAVHRYDWYLQLAPDLKLHRSEGNDIVLCSKSAGDEPPDQEPMLLVRILDMAENKSAKPVEPVRIEQTIYQRLAITTQAIEPLFKILLFPYRNGEPLPTTAFDRKDGKLSIEWPDQKDGFSFKSDPGGRTTFVLKRGGGQSVSVK